MAKGGITKGKSHKEGGIPMVVKSTGQKVELEGGEGVINKRNMADTKKHKFDGKELTKCEIVSEINEDYGNGVKIDCDDIVGRKYKYAKGGQIQVDYFDEDGELDGESDVFEKKEETKAITKTKKRIKELEKEYGQTIRASFSTIEDGSIDDEGYLEISNKGEVKRYAKGGFLSIDEKRERVIDYFINNEDDEELISRMGNNIKNNYRDWAKEILEDRDGNYDELYKWISNNYDDEDVNYFYYQYSLSPIYDDGYWKNYPDGKSNFAKGGKTPEYHWFVLDVENDTLINGFEKEYKDDAKEFIDGEVEDDKEYRKNFKIISKRTKEQMGYEYPVKNKAGGYLAIASQLKGLAPKSFDKADEMVADRLPTKPKEIITQWWEVNDDKTNKTLQFSGETLEEAIAKSEKIDFTKYQEGQKVYAKGGYLGRDYVDFDDMTFSEFYNYLNENDLGYWDNVNSEDIVRMYIDDMKNNDVNVSHIEEVLENNPSRQELYEIWLGNSMETPTPINTKEELLEALDLNKKDYFAKGGETKRWIKTQGDVNEGSFVEKADKKNMSVKNYAKKVLKDTKTKDDFKVLEDWEDYKASAKGQKEIALRKSAQFVKNIQNFAKGGNIPMRDNYSDKQKSIIRILNKYNYKNLSPQQKAEIYQWNGINDRQLSEELVSKIWGLVLKHLKIEFKDAYVLNAGSGRFWDYSPTLISLNKPKDEKYTICFGNLPKGADKDIFQSRIHDVDDKENKADYILGLDAKYLTRRMGKSKYSPTSMILNFDRDYFKGNYETTLGMIKAVREHSEMLRVDGIGVISFYIDKDSFINLEDFTQDIYWEKPPYKIKESIRVKSNSEYDIFIIVIQKILR